MTKKDFQCNYCTIAQKIDYASGIVAHGKAIKYKSMHYHACVDFLRKFAPHALYCAE